MPAIGPACLFMTEKETSLDRSRCAVAMQSALWRNARWPVTSLSPIR